MNPMRPLAASDATPVAKFVLTSSTVEDGGIIPDEHVFAGGNRSPELHWVGAPPGTRSFTLTLFDPDAPRNGWWHWVVFNIPAEVDHLPAGAGDPAAELAPAGSVQSRTDFGRPGYGGPCPPVGDPPHRYVFTVYALDVEGLALASDASGATVRFNLRQHALATANLTARYGR
jgi:Raf kinase inhibitor-like YbhB/YbcL family protein